jgi:hypothetical protein
VITGKVRLYRLFDLTQEEGQVEFDLILTNPPFQDSVKRKKTPHKLWIDFTLQVFDKLLKEGGSLVQVSPASFSSPSNKVLTLMSRNTTKVLRFGTGHHFPTVGSSFSDYWIEKSSNQSQVTRVQSPEGDFEFCLSEKTQYLPNDICEQSLGIHEKVMHRDGSKLDVKWDYVTAHNIRRYDKFPTLVEQQDTQHPHPVFHTNRSIWYSSIRQDWAGLKKVMWTRSGYTLPFFDPGELGGTDMVYYVAVANEVEGRNLAKNLNLLLMKYIFKTAKWSGFGNERVFSSLPDLPRDKELSDNELFQEFALTEEEVAYVESVMGQNRPGTR